MKRRKDHDEKLRDEFEAQKHEDSKYSIVCHHTASGWDAVRTVAGTYHALKQDEAGRLIGTVWKTLPFDVTVRTVLYKDRIYDDSLYAERGWDQFGLETVNVSKKFTNVEEAAQSYRETMEHLINFSGWQVDEHVAGEALYIHIDLDWCLDRTD